MRYLDCTPSPLLTLLRSVNLADDGKAALLKLSKGDMRRALNVLQACHAAYERIGETEIYTCTGSPHPSDIEAIVDSMTCEEFTASHQSEHSHFTSRARRLTQWFAEINALKIDRGLALQDLLAGAYEYIDTMEFPPAARVYLLDQIATTE